MSSAASTETTRERVLAVALTLMAQRGYEATSLDGVAAAAGLTKQAILYHFTSKEGLLGAVIDQAAADLAVAVSGGAPSGATGVVDAVLRLGAERPELLELAREVVRLGPPASSRLFAALTPLLDRAALTIPAERVLGMAAQVIALATEVEVLRAAGLVPTAAWLRRRRRSILAEFPAP